MKKKLLALLLSTAMIATCATGCGSDSSSSSTGGASTAPSAETNAAPIDVNLTVWSPQEEQNTYDAAPDGLLQTMCENFNEAHPEWNIKFEYGVCAEGDAKDTVTKDVAAAADVYMYANDQIPTLVDAGALSQLGGDTLTQIQEAQPETMVNSVTYNGGVYGVPFTSNTWFMFYDKSKFTEDEITSLDTMMAKDLGKGVTNVAFPLNNSWYFASFYYAGGGTLFGDGTDASAGTNFGELTDVTDYLVDLASNKKFVNDADGLAVARMKEGTLGAMFSGSWDAATLSEALGDNFGCAQLPTVTIGDKTETLKSFAGSKAIGVNPNCENQEVAVALAAYLGSEEAQQLRFDAREVIPTNNNVANSDAVKASAVATAQANTISNTSVVQPLLQEMSSYWDPAASLGNELVQGDVTHDNSAEKTKAFGEGVVSSGL